MDASEPKNPPDQPQEVKMLKISQEIISCQHIECSVDKQPRRKDAQEITVVRIVK